MVLTIAGSDSGAGAGLQADLKTLAAHRVFGVTAVTALTVQSTCEVRQVHPVDPEVVIAQIDCLFDDMPIAAVKTGMLASSATVSAVADALQRRAGCPLVVDPVMVSSTGKRLLDQDALGAYLRLLFPIADLVTPNMAEAAVLTGLEVTCLADMERAAIEILGTGCSAVLVKGGHLTGEAKAVDVLADRSGISYFEGDFVESRNVHGSGCSLASAVAANLAKGLDLMSAVEAATSYVRRAIAGSSNWRIGRGHGPLDHFGWGPAR